MMQAWGRKERPAVEPGAPSKSSSQDSDSHHDSTVIAPATTDGPIFAKYVVSSTGRLHRPMYNDGSWFAMCGGVRPAWTRLTPPIVHAETVLLSPSVTCGTCERVMRERGLA